MEVLEKLFGLNILGKRVSQKREAHLPVSTTRRGLRFVAWMFGTARVVRVVVLYVVVMLRWEGL